MKKTWSALIATAVLACGSAAWAQTSGQGAAQGTTHGTSMGTMKSGAASTKGSPDAAFMTDAAKGGMAEVRLGQLAEKRAKSAKVKDFGARMVKDHSKANDELKALAAKKKITLPKDVGPENQRTETNLTKLSGEAFDKAYMTAMVADHEKDVAAFEKEAKSGKDPEVKAWAAKTLPVLREHLKMAKSDNAMEHSMQHEKAAGEHGGTMEKGKK